MTDHSRHTAEPLLILVDAMRDYAQLPPRPARVNLAFASAAWILLTAEIVLPAALLLAFAWIRLG